MATNRLTLNDANIAQILATMTEHLGRMTDPSYSKKLRQDLLTLPDEVKAATAQAQETIAKADSFKAALKKQEDDANEKLAQREQLVSKREKEVETAKSLKVEAEAIAAKNAEREMALKKEADRLTSISMQHVETEKKHKVSLDKIAEENKKLDIRKVELDKRESAIKDYEREVEETAQQMSGLVKAKLKK